MATLEAGARMTDTDVVRFGERVRKLRVERGLTLRDMSERTSMSVPTLSQIERGYERRENIKIGTLARIAAALDVTPSEILDGVDEFPGD